MHSKKYGKLSAPPFSNYWGQSGTIDLIKKNIASQYLEQITDASLGKRFADTVTDRIPGSDLNGFTRPGSFYSLLIQTGYLTYDELKNGEDISNVFDIYAPNHELRSVIRDFILESLYELPKENIIDVFEHIENPVIFQGRLKELISNKLSYFDFDTYEPEKTYHVYLLGMFAGAGLKPLSNKESGKGRYDMFLNINNTNYIFEFKKAPKIKPSQIENYDGDYEDLLKEHLEPACFEAIEQIRNKNYASELADPNDPTYLVGIGFMGKENLVRVQKL